VGACERGENRDSNRLWVSGGGRPERVEKRSRRDRLKGKRGDVVDPIAPADHESEAIAERASGIHVKATGLRGHCGELGHRNDAEQSVDTTRTQNSTMRCELPSAAATVPGSRRIPTPTVPPITAGPTVRRIQPKERP